MDSWQVASFLISCTSRNWLEIFQSIKSSLRFVFQNLRFWIWASLLYPEVYCYDEIFFEGNIQTDNTLGGVVMPSITYRLAIPWVDLPSMTSRLAIPWVDLPNMITTYCKNYFEVKFFGHMDSWQVASFLISCTSRNWLEIFQSIKSSLRFVFQNLRF